LSPTVHRNEARSHVDVSRRAAGNAAGVSTVRLGEHIDIYGPQREQPRHWRGTEHAALELLSLLPDDAGVSPFWKTFTSWYPGELVPPRRP